MDKTCPMADLPGWFLTCVCWLLITGYRSGPAGLGQRPSGRLGKEKQKDVTRRAPGRKVGRKLHHSGPQLFPERSRRHHQHRNANTGAQAAAKAAACHQSELQPQRTTMIARHTKRTKAPQSARRNKTDRGKRTVARHRTPQRPEMAALCFIRATRLMFCGKRAGRPNHYRP